MCMQLIYNNFRKLLPYSRYWNRFIITFIEDGRDKCTRCGQAFSDAGEEDGDKENKNSTETVSQVSSTSRTSGKTESDNGECGGNVTLSTSIKNDKGEKDEEKKMCEKRLVEQGDKEAHIERVQEAKINITL